MKDIRTAVNAQLAIAEETKSDFITLTVAEGKRILKLLKEQEEIIKQYQKADGFLFTHGWKWEVR